MSFEALLGSAFIGFIVLMVLGAIECNSVKKYGEECAKKGIMPVFNMY